MSVSHLLWFTRRAGILSPESILRWTRSSRWTRKVEKVAGNFGFLEGPVWVHKGNYLLFSDIPANVIYKYNPSDGKVSVAVPYSGFSGTDSIDVGMQMNNGQAMVILLGSNGITTDPQGRVVYCTHGDHQIVRIEPDGRRTVLANQFEGKRLNSPNDLVFQV